MLNMDMKWTYIAPILMSLESCDDELSNQGWAIQLNFHLNSIQFNSCVFGVNSIQFNSRPEITFSRINSIQFKFELKVNSIQTNSASIQGHPKYFPCGEKIIENGSIFFEKSAN